MPAAISGCKSCGGMEGFLLFVILYHFFRLGNGLYYMKTIVESGEMGTAGIWSDTNGNIYFCLDFDSSVRKISSDGIISTIIQASSIRSGANSIYGDSNGDYLYFSDGYYCLWRYSFVTGNVSRYAGAIPTSYGLRGDGGQATLAVLNTPVGLFLSSVGILYFADQGNHRIRMINTSTGIINTFAGSSDGFSGDNGLTTAAELSSPQSVWGNSMGVIFITDSGNRRIRQVQGNNNICWDRISNR